MEAVQNWTKEYFLNNEEICMEKLNSLTAEERAILRENLELAENNKLVLAFGMVIDTQEPEFYCEKYEVKTSDGTIRVENGKFSDKLNINDDETVDDPSKHLSERQTVVIAKPSSTNQWVFDAAIAKASNKRKLGEGKESEQSFTVKVYDTIDRPINTVVEVIGFLSIVPKRATEAMETDNGFGEDLSVNLPPLQIHAITMKELPHNNPLLLDQVTSDEQLAPADIQKDLLKVLTQFMFGDEVAAHYILLHLLSNVYGRVAGEILGKFSVNLTCQAVPKELLVDHIKKFYNFIELLVPDSSYLPLTIENFNSKTFVPKKDYKTNRLQPGLLQLPKHTHLVLDETKLDCGKLEQAGCLAVGDLSELIKSQQINYDFQFYKIPFQTNIPVMIISEGKSLLPSDFIVPIKITDPDTLRLINENTAAGVHFLKPKLNAVRRYLTECRISDFEIGESETKMIETDFVKMREETNLEVQHLHSLLVISRLIGISMGLKNLDLASWELAKKLELERFNRVEKKPNEV